MSWMESSYQKQMLVFNEEMSVVYILLKESGAIII